jgi:hypothetical protein
MQDGREYVRPRWGILQQTMLRRLHLYRAAGLPRRQHHSTLCTERALLFRQCQLTPADIGGCTLLPFGVLCDHPWHYLSGNCNEVPGICRV